MNRSVRSIHPSAILAILAGLGGFLAAWSECREPSRDDGLSACSYNCDTLRPNGANCTITRYYGGDGTCDCSPDTNCTTDPEHQWPPESSWVRYTGTCSQGVCSGGLTLQAWGTSMPSAFLPVYCGD